MALLVSVALITNLIRISWSVLFLYLSLNNDLARL